MQEQTRALMDTLNRWDECSRYEGYEGAICEDCGKACERVRLVPEFAFLGCDACYDSCVAMLAEEAAELLAVEARRLARSRLLVKRLAANFDSAKGTLPIVRRPNLSTV